MILIEENFENVDTLIESADGGKTYLRGIFSVAENKNKNRRTYSKDDVALASNIINEAAERNHHILGHLDHPADLQVRLEDVSHRIISSHMDGNTAYAKMEILEKHPKGAIAKALIDSGVQLGVSTRGSGAVNESTGAVKNYRFVTVDLVANPSCDTAYPETLREQLEMYNRGPEIEKLSNAVVHDPVAQLYFGREMKKFIETLYN